MPPYEDETYIRLSAKEMIYNLDKKIDRLDEKVDGLIVAHAALPAVYVTQASIDSSRRESVVAKRYAITAIISSLAAVVGVLTLIA